MDDRNQENLKELIAKFFDAEQAERCAEDFRRAERIFHEHPAPAPDPMFIANIKAEIAMRLDSRRVRRYRRMLYEAAGIAAAIVILAVVGLQMFEESDNQSGKSLQTASLIPRAIWESDNITADDAELAVFTAEIEQIESEIKTLQSGGEFGESENTLTELEMELAEFDSDFWKG
jgi:cell division protein FtsB